MSMQNELLLELYIDNEHSGGRIDLILAEAFPDFSRGYIQKLIESGQVMISGTLCLSKKHKVSAGDFLTCTVPEPKNLSIKAEPIPLDIVHEDKDVLIVNKPKGMVVHPAPGNEDGTLVNAVMHHCKDSLSSINGVVRPGIVHRIDKDTSGLIMIAKNDTAHRALAEQLAAHSITRTYRAIVYDNFTNDEGTISEKVGRDPRNRLRQAVTEANGRDAVTHYKVLERFGKFTYIEARLETGRTHQIRVHMAYIKHPLLGDQVYGPKKKILGTETQMLHAKTLGFVHPKTGKYIEFDSDIPGEFKRVLDKLREGDQ